MVLGAGFEVEVVGADKDQCRLWHDQESYSHQSFCSVPSTFDVYIFD